MSTETRELAAGRALDAEVARRVFGCSPELDKWAAHEDYHCGCEGFPHNRETEGQTSLELYSTDIAAAWKVVERMMAQGWGYELSDMTDDWHSMLFIHHDPDDGANAGGETPAEAICRAALKALANSSEPVTTP